MFPLTLTVLVNGNGERERNTIGEKERLTVNILSLLFQQERGKVTWMGNGDDERRVFF